MDNLLNIPDDAWVFSFKRNVDGDDLDGHESALTSLGFIEDQCGRENILYTCLGKHINGEAKIPHHHFTIITRNPPRFNDKTKSTAKARYCEKEEISPDLIGTSKVRQINKDKCKFEPLAYPLKEGLGYFDEQQLRRDLYKNLNQVSYDTLMALGKDLYLKKLGEHERRDKCDLKKRNIFEQFKLFVDSAAPYGMPNLRELQEIATSFYEQLEEDKKPATANMVEMIKRYALSKSIISFSDLMNI